MTDRPIIFSAPMVRALLEGRKTQTRRLAWGTYNGPTGESVFHRETPWVKAKPGDRLWVRESVWLPDPKQTTAEYPLYRADGHAFVRHYVRRPSIHMPRWASRLTLTVTDVKVQRLILICHNDLLREGVHQAAANSWTAGDNIFAGSAYAAFRGLWERLHGADAWDANPEVVALTFTVGLHNIDQQRSAA